LFAEEQNSTVLKDSFFLPKNTVFKNIKIALMNTDTNAETPETDTISLLKAHTFFHGEGCLNTNDFNSMVNLSCFQTMESLFELFEV